MSLFTNELAQSQRRAKFGVFNMVFYDFPREMAIQAPHRRTSRWVIHNSHEFYSTIKKHLLYSHIFTSVYKFADILDGAAVYQSAYIDKVYYDIDPKDYPTTEDLLNMAQSVVDYMKTQKIVVDLSGRGFHIYQIAELDPQPVNKAQYVRAIQDDVIEHTKLVLDPVCHGRLDTLCRVIGTRNIKSRLFCRSLTRKELELTYKEIQDLAKTQSNEIHYIGHNPLKYNQTLDIEGQYTNFNLENDGVSYITATDLRKALHECGIIADELPPCVIAIMSAKTHSYEERFLLINYLKYAGLSIDDTRKILSLVLDSSLYYHVTGLRCGPVDREVLSLEIEHQDEFIYKKDYYLSCKKAQECSLCQFYQCKSHNIMEGLT